MRVRDVDGDDGDEMNEDDPLGCLGVKNDDSFEFLQPEEADYGGMHSEERQDSVTMVLLYHFGSFGASLAYISPSQIPQGYSLVNLREHAGK